MPVNYLSDQELERRAIRLLAQYEAQEGNIREPPVPIDLLIENLLEIDIDWAPLSSPDDSVRVLAAIEVTPVRRRILMNERERSHFDRFFGTEAFSKAHEVGHAVLHLPQAPALQPPLWGQDSIVLCRSDHLDSQEIQAERFAAYLLIPEPLLRSTIAHRPILDWPQIYELRDAFKVSITAMRRRLEALNLVYVDSDGRVLPSREAGSGQLAFPL